MLSKKVGDDISESFFSYFTQKNMLRYFMHLHEMSNPICICMKCRILFTVENKINIINTLSAECGH